MHLQLVTCRSQSHSSWMPQLSYLTHINSVNFTKLVLKLIELNGLVAANTQGLMVQVFVSCQFSTDIWMTTCGEYFTTEEEERGSFLYGRHLCNLINYLKSTEASQFSIN